MNKELLVKLIDEGNSTYGIANATGKSQTNVRLWLRKYGLNTHTQNFHKEYKDRLNGRKCLYCDGDLIGGKRMYCNKNCKMKYHYHNGSTPNANTNSRQKDISKKRKKILIDMHGGGCIVCGYNKNSAVLQFHHRNPEEKTFNLDSRKLSNTKWESILLESAKCDLMCSNCHIELHNPDKFIE